MRTAIIKNIKCEIIGNVSNEEIEETLKIVKQKNKHNIIKANIVVDGEFLNINYEYKLPPITRLRRITGYLVGNMERWCDSKKAEEGDRVKHGIRV